LWYWRRHEGLFLSIDCCSSWLNLFSWRRQSQIPTATSPTYLKTFDKCACQFHLYKPILLNISGKIQKFVIETRKNKKNHFLSWCEASNTKSTFIFGLHKIFKEWATTSMQIYGICHMWNISMGQDLRIW